MSVIWVKVWHDIWGRKGRTALVVLSIAAGVFAIGTIFGMVDQLLTNMDASHIASKPSHINVFLRRPITKEIVESIEKLEGIAGVEPMNSWTARYRTDPSEPWKSTFRKPLNDS